METLNDQNKLQRESVKLVLLPPAWQITASLASTPLPLSLISPVELDEIEWENSFSKAAKRVLILWSVRNRQ